MAVRYLDGEHETVKYNDASGVRLYHNNESDSYDTHWHTAIEIISPVENIYTIQIGKEKIVLQEDDILLIPAGILHKLIAPETGRRLIFLFDTNFLTGIRDMSSLMQSVSPYLLVRKEDYPAVNAKLHICLEKIDEEYQDEKPFCCATILAYIVQFLSILGRAQIKMDNKFADTTSSKRHEYIGKFMDICSYISEHSTEDLTVEDLAYMAGFSKFHFSRLFKEFTGVSCYEYLTGCRISLAQQFLTQAELPITDVAMQSGFNSLSTFNRIFKQKVGCTPKEYKNMRRNAPYGAPEKELELTHTP